MIRERRIQATNLHGSNGAHAEAEEYGAELRSGAPLPSIRELRDEIAFWRARFDQERERLAKLWVAYQDLEMELEARRGDERAAQAEAVVAAAAARMGPFRQGPFALYARDVKLKNGRVQTIHFFAKRRPRSGQPVPLPDGFEVQGRTRTGLPFLRRIGAPRPPKKPERRLQPQCAALTPGSRQCRNSARDGSKYCASHAGYRPPSVEAFLKKLDTKPRVAGAPDTHPVAHRGTSVVRVPVEDVGRPRAKAIGAPTHEPQCGAFTAGGPQCRNLARDGSKYCALHHGFRPPTVARLVQAHATRPKARGAPDAPPALRRAA